MKGLRFALESSVQQGSFGGYSQPQPTVTIDMILGSLVNDSKSVFTPENIQTLKSLNYKDSKSPIVSMSDLETIYNIYGMMITEPKISFGDLLDVLSDCATPRDIVFKCPQLIFARSTEVLKTNLLQGTFQITEAKK